MCEKFYVRGGGTVVRGEGTPSTTTATQAAPAAFRAADANQPGRNREGAAPLGDPLPQPGILPGAGMPKPGTYR